MDSEAAELKCCSFFIYALEQRLGVLLMHDGPKRPRKDLPAWNCSHAVLKKGQVVANEATRFIEGVPHSVYQSFLMDSPKLWNNGWNSGCFFRQYRSPLQQSNAVKLMTRFSHRPSNARGRFMLSLCRRTQRQLVMPYERIRNLIMAISWTNRNAHDQPLSERRPNLLNDVETNGIIHRHANNFRAAWTTRSHDSAL